MKTQYPRQSIIFSFLNMFDVNEIHFTRKWYYAWWLLKSLSSTLRLESTDEHRHYMERTSISSVLWFCLFCYFMLLYHFVLQAIELLRFRLLRLSVSILCKKDCHPYWRQKIQQLCLRSQVVVIFSHKLKSYAS